MCRWPVPRARRPATPWVRDGTRAHHGRVQAIRNAVAERIEVLDANFLAALNGYIQVAAARQEEGLQELLEAVRDEVLRQVAKRLPPAARYTRVDSGSVRDAGAPPAARGT